METIDLFKKLPLSPGLKVALEEIELLESEKKISTAFDKTIESLGMIRISDAILRYKLAKLCHQKGDTCSAKALFAKAIEHLRKEVPAEQLVIDAIKKEIA